MSRIKRYEKPLEQMNGSELLKGLREYFDAGPDFTSRDAEMDRRVQDAREKNAAKLAAKLAAKQPTN